MLSSAEIMDCFCFTLLTGLSRVIRKQYEWIKTLYIKHESSEIDLHSNVL